MNSRTVCVCVTGFLLTDEELLQWVNSAMPSSLRWFHRESFDVCYLCFHDKEQALFVKHFLNVHVFSMVNDSLVGLMHAETLPSYIENRLLSVVDMIEKKNDFQPNVLVKVCASTTLTVQDWLQIFPTAYDFHRTQLQSKVVVEFCRVEDAKKAIELVNKKSHIINKRGVDLSVYVVCEYASTKYMKTVSKKLNSCLIEKIRYEDTLAQKVVEWLEL